MPLIYDSAPPLRMDQGLRYDSGPAPSPNQPKLRNKNMTKFKLELDRKKTNDKLVLGAAHIAAMNGNANYPVATRVPTDAQVQTAQNDLSTAEAEVDAAEIAWKQKIQERDAAEAAWDTVITARAGNCESVTPNNLPALASTGFPLRNGGSPIGPLPAPGDLRTSPSANTGEIELKCNAVKGASSYEWQCRLHDSAGVTWEGFKTSTSSRVTATGLTPGALYALRVRGIGSAGSGTWSDEAVQRAP